MKALVTGANGFVGSHLVDALVARGDDVTCIVRPTSDLTWLDTQSVAIVHGDVTNADALAAAVAGVDVVFHLAAMLRGRDYAAYYRVNAEGARNVAQACRRSADGPPRLVYCSSQAAAGPSVDGRRRTEGDAPAPVSDYGRSKLEGERAVAEVAEGAFPHVALRPPAVYGPRDTDILIYFRMISRGIAPFVGDGRQAFDLMYVADLVSAFLMVATNPDAVGSVYYVNDDAEHTWRSMAADIGRVLGRRALPLPIPLPAIAVVARVAEFAAAARGVAPVIHRQKVTEFRQAAWQCDSSRIREELGFKSEYD
ncbi:NAD(P)-dependent oxidoreductase, partial [Candidatus Poribacteria bacterium]|nr:NAD(P)-dependent oxidoreductase [Candidatus Poribacteria bacterium]